jgi:pyruvate formate lyase activating enzyme
MNGGVAYRRTSLIDFPGKVAAVLFLPGCNFRCPYCQNASLVNPASGDAGLVPLGEFLEFLDRRKRLLGALVISGGEPLARAETPRIAAAARERGLAVKLDTNGSFPERIAEARPDYVALDIKTAPSAYSRVAPGLADAGERALESLVRLRDSGVDYEVRITCAPGVFGEAEAEELLGFLEPGDPVVLQDFRPGGCLDPAYDSVEPYSRGEMETLASILRRVAPGARIRGG